MLIADHAVGYGKGSDICHSLCHSCRGFADYPSPNRRTKYAGKPPAGPLVEVVGEEPLVPVEPLDPPADPLVEVVDELPLLPVEPVEFPVPEPTGPVTAGGLPAGGATVVAGTVVAGALADGAVGAAPAAVTVTVPCIFG